MRCLTLQLPKIDNPKISKVEKKKLTITHMKVEVHIGYCKLDLTNVLFPSDNKEIDSSQFVTKLMINYK